MVDLITAEEKDLGAAIKYCNKKSPKNLSTPTEDKYKLVSTIIEKFKEDHFNNRKESGIAFYQWKIFNSVLLTHQMKSVTSWKKIISHQKNFQP